MSQFSKQVSKKALILLMEFNSSVERKKIKDQKINQKKKKKKWEFLPIGSKSLDQIKFGEKTLDRFDVFIKVTSLKFIISFNVLLSK